MHVICIWNWKGGVAKTTSVINVASVLSHAGFRVVSVDVDPQGSLTGVAGVDTSEVSAAASIYGAMLPTEVPEPVPVQEMLLPAPWGGELLPASDEAVNLESDLERSLNPHPSLRDALDQIGDAYDYAVVDCGAGTGRIAYAVLWAADGLYVPVQLQSMAASPLRKLFETIDLFDQLVLAREGRKVPFGGVFGTFADHTSHCREIVAALIETLGDDFIRTLIPRTVRLADASVAGEGLVTYDPRSKAARRYARLAVEMLERDGRSQDAARLQQTYELDERVSA